MYITLFELTSFALPGWLVLMFLPKWRITRWVAQSAAFPVYLAVLYVLGIVALLSDLGPGMIQDFGNASGVTRLLARQDVALVAWIHILTFDQVVGLYIYRDNMRHRYVPLVVQSVLLFLTFMFGPVGFLAYYLARQARRRLQPMDQVYSTQDVTTPTEPRPTGRTASFLGLFAEARPLLWLGIAGLALAGACALVMAVRGPVIPPEGELMKAITFDAAIGIYVLTIAVFVPLAGFSAKGRPLWLGWMIALTVGAYGIETTQILRGLDPRFSRYGSPADQIAGSILGLVAVGLIVTFIILAVKMVRRPLTGSDGLLLLGIRYATGATMLAFAAGVWMSVNQGRFIGSAGSLLPLHALGFHGLQAVPLVALLLARSTVPPDRTRRWVHLAGTLWIAACLAVAWQTAMGRSVGELAVATAIAAVVLVAWALVAMQALLAWRRRPSVVAS